jgi:CBS domain-containing protein
MNTVRDAMVSNPGQLTADSSAQAAGELLQRPEVRAIYVTEDERLVGVVTRKTLVREVIAHEEAFRFLEAEDAERVPVVDEDHRLMGVLSRSVLQRRLAEDEDEPLPPAA